MIPLSAAELVLYKIPLFANNVQLAAVEATVASHEQLISYTMKDNTYTHIEIKILPIITCGKQLSMS